MARWRTWSLLLVCALTACTPAIPAPARLLFASPAPDAVILQVKDTGEGIEPCELPHIWERFYRTERARENPSSGTGLGLALVKELTEAMGGAVTVESTLCEGSCFTLRLRCAASEADGLCEANTPTTPAEAA